MSETTTKKLLCDFIAARRDYTAAWQRVSDAYDAAKESKDYPKPDPFQNPKLEGLEVWQFNVILREHRKLEEQAYKEHGGRDADRRHKPALKHLEAVECKIAKLPPTSHLNVFAKMVMYATWECADHGDDNNYLDVVLGWSKSFGALGTEAGAFLQERAALGGRA